MAVGEVTMTITASYTQFNLAVMEADKSFQRFAKALRRCYSGPGLLCIDGHEYHRRQRRRVKRSR